MIKLVIFDLDGVLVDSREQHYQALNIALKEVDEKYVITEKEHLTIYDGRTTRNKLEILTKDKGLDESLYDDIWRRKQEVTFDIIRETVKKDDKLVSLFKRLKNDKIKVYVASNSIRETVKLILLQKELMEYVDGFFSNEDVISSKPHPEMYMQCMIKEKVLPKETMIVEDSYVGRKAAMSSGANLLPVKNPDEVTEDRLYNEMKRPIKEPIWRDDKLNVLIPMAGAGSRFAKAGYTFPKPLIEVKGKPMIQVVSENMNVDAHFIYIVQKEHYEKYNLKSVLNAIKPGCSIVQVDSLTEGAACTALLAKDLINNDKPLLIANSDQFVKWNSGEFFHAMNSPGIDGGIITFKSNHPKWSYVKLDKYGNVSEVKEKEVISDEATIGLYYFNKGSDFVESAEQMIEADDRSKGEFYIAPVYNYMYKNDKKVKIFNIERSDFYGLGVPEDLNYFLQNYKGSL